MTEPLEPPAASTAASAAATAPRARQRRLSTVSLASGVDLDRTVAAAPLFDVIQELVQHEAAADVPFPSVYCPPSLLAFDEPTDGGGGGGSDDGGGVDGAAATVRQRPEDPAALREEGRKLRGEVTYWKHQAEKKVRGGGGGGGGDGNLLGEPTGDCGGLQLSMVGSGPPGDNIADDVRRLRSEAARWRRRAESTAGRGDSTAAAAAAVALASPTTGRRRASTTLERHEVAAAAAAAAASLQRPTNEGATAGGGSVRQRESLRELLAWRPPSPIRWDRDRLGVRKYEGTLGEPRARSGSGSGSGSSVGGKPGRSGGGGVGTSLSVS